MQRDKVQDTTGPRYRTKTTVYEAAEVLGITVDAIRKRIQRGTIPHERHEDGRVYVLLDETSTSRDTSEDTYRTIQGDLVDSLRDQVEYLRDQLSIRSEELRRKDHLIAALTERIPELPPSSPRDVPEDAAKASNGSMGTTAPKGDESPQNGAQRPWWRRLLGT